MTKPNDEYFGTEGCAEFIDRSPGAVRNLVMRRKIPFRKPGGRLMFIKSEIVEWIENSPGMTPGEIAEGNSHD